MWKKLPIKHTNWFGFKHEGVMEKFNTVKYLGDIQIGNSSTHAIYYANNPDRSKGHMNIVLLTDQYVSGMDFRKFKKEAIVDGIFCNTCKIALYSPNRHGMVSCDCGNVSVDGGKDYLRISYRTGDDYKTCTINLLTQRVKLD